MPTTPRLLLAAAAALSMNIALAQAGPDAWQPAGEAHGIKLYTREVPGRVLRDFKGSMLVDAPLAQVAATLADVSTMHEWFYLLRGARFIKGEHVDDSYIYLSMNGIWPVSPRDVVAHVSVKQDPSTLAIKVTVDSVEGLMPEQDGYVRLPSMRSSWTLTPVSANRTDVEVIGSADPGGWIPLRLANFVVTELPKESLLKMRQHIAKPAYRDVARIYAKNPKLRELAERLVFPK